MRAILILTLFALSTMGGELNLQQIMADPVWIGQIPQSVRFGPDEHVLFIEVGQEWHQPNTWLQVSLKSGKVGGVEMSMKPWAYASGRHRQGALEVLEVDPPGQATQIWWRRGKGPIQPLVVEQAGATFVRFLGEQAIVVLKQDQLYRVALGTPSMVPLTDVRLDDEPKTEDDWYANEEKDILDYVSTLHKQEEASKNRSDEGRLMPGLEVPKPVYLGKGWSLGHAFVQPWESAGFSVSEDLRFVSLVVAPDKEGEPSTYAQYINREATVQTLKARPRVGYLTKNWKLGMLDRDSWEVKWADFSELPDIKTDRLAELKEKLTEEQKKFLTKQEEGPRPVMVIGGGFRPGGGKYLATLFSRDNKDKWVVLVDPATLEVTLLFHHFDPAWVQFYNNGVDGLEDNSGAAFWRKDGEAVAFLSDKDGFQQLFQYDLATGKTTNLTPGELEVYVPVESEDGKSWFFHSNKVHPGERHYYRMPIEGGKWEALTEAEGRHRVRQYPGGKLMANLFAYINRPAELQISRGGGKWETVFDGRSEAFKAMDLHIPEVVSYTNRDGKQVYARLYKPENPNGAGVVFVHGAGYLQNAHKGWSVYFREYMFNNMLRQKGYTVLDPDFQASSGYGRDWRTAIYRHMGGADLDDVTDGAKWIASEHGVEAARIGIYGGSYGGFLSIMAMFTQGDVFRCGGALRPVTDWAYYNHWYTHRILNTPTVDPEAYRRSSPIHFADGLKGELELYHGMVDDNVQFQDSVRLAQKLTELRKSGWALVPFPVEPHGFKTPYAWYDEYRRILALMERNLRR